MGRLLPVLFLFLAAHAGCASDTPRMTARGTTTSSSAVDAVRPAEEECVQAESEGDENNQPVTLRLCVSTTTPMRGESVSFKVDADDPDARLFPLSECMPNGIYFGEGPQCYGTPACAEPAEPVAAEPGTVSQTFQRAYAEPGTYPVTVQVQSGSQCRHPYSSWTQVKIDLVVGES